MPNRLLGRSFIVASVVFFCFLPYMVLFSVAISEIADVVLGSMPNPLLALFCMLILTWSGVLSTSLNPRVRRSLLR